MCSCRKANRGVRLAICAILNLARGLNRTNRKPGTKSILNSLEGNPKGCKKVAGGRSAAKTTGRRRIISRTPEGCKRIDLLMSGETLRQWDVGLQSSSTPSGCDPKIHRVPVVFATLRPPATFSQPFGLGCCNFVFAKQVRLNDEYRNSTIGPDRSRARPRDLMNPHLRLGYCPASYAPLFEPASELIEPQTCLLSSLARL